MAGFAVLTQVAPIRKTVNEIKPECGYIWGKHSTGGRRCVPHDHAGPETRWGLPFHYMGVLHGLRWLHVNQPDALVLEPAEQVPTAFGKIHWLNCSVAMKLGAIRISEQKTSAHEGHLRRCSASRVTRKTFGTSISSSCGLANRMRISPPSICSCRFIPRVVALRVICAGCSSSDTSSPGC